MRVLLVSKFLHHVGGVETYLNWLATALADNGHDVSVVGMTPPPGRSAMALGGARLFQTPVRQFVDAPLRTRLASASSSVYSPAAGGVIRKAIHSFRPDVVHFHGTSYQLTTSVFHAAQSAGLARLATQHEYKLTCANQRLWDDSRGMICTDCVGLRGLRRGAAPVRRRCIKASLGASAIGSVEDAVASKVLRSDSALLLHVPSHFMRDVLERDGWPATRIRYVDLPWVPKPEPEPEPAGRRTSFFYMGRLAPEKDVGTLLRAWARVEGQLPDAHLRIAGDGADGAALRRLALELKVTRVAFLGRLDASEIVSELSSATATLHPSAWYENSPLAVRESLCSGVPALVANRGGMPELVQDGVTGRVVEHAEQTWADAIQDHYARPQYDAEQIREHVSRHRTLPSQHIESITGLYDACGAASRAR